MPTTTERITDIGYRV
jgi:SAM-dependent methyltransferase